MKLINRTNATMALLLVALLFLIAFQNCGQAMKFQPIASVDPNSTKNIDAMCASGAIDPDQVVFPPFVPLEPPTLPTNCANGFELNNQMGGSYTINSSTPAGSRAITLALDLATYVAPDDLKITATGSSGSSNVLFHTCRMGTWAAADPTDGTSRPPDDTIRQFRVYLPPGTTSLNFDYARVDSPTYVRVLGLCDFNILPPQPDVGARFRLSP